MNEHSEGELFAVYGCIYGIGGTVKMGARVRASEGERTAEGEGERSRRGGEAVKLSVEQ